MTHEHIIRQAILFADALEPLEKVGGLSILKRNILSLARTGISEVFVVHSSDSLMETALSDVDLVESEIQIEAVITDIPGQLKGETLTNLQEKLDEHVLLLRCQHIWDVQALTSVTTQNPSSKLVMVVDSQDRELGEPLPGYLRVQLDDQEVSGLNGAVADAIDTGLWLVPTALLGELATGYDEDLSFAGLDSLVETENVCIAEFAGEYWHFVGTTTSMRRAERALLISLTKPTDGPVVRHISRRVSRLVTNVLMNTNATPNQVTLLSTMVGVLGVILIFQATWSYLILGATVLELQHMLDCCDGELARLKFKGSAIGEWMDTIADGLLNMGYALALGWFCKEMFDTTFYWHLALASVAGYALYDGVVYGQLFFVHRRGSGIHFRWWFQKKDLYIKNSLDGGSPLSRIFGAAHALTRREVFLWGFLGLAILHLPHIAVIWYAVLAAGHASITATHVLAGGMRRAA
ncbi:MAG: hypothetical protein GY811_22525 [Myxococcales bacterium]|nr:hypothetical protein [Myxococcales bacterium]